MVRFISPGIFGLVLVCGNSPSATAQGVPPTVQSQDQFFSGTITALSDSNITVSRTVLGKESAVRTFIITPETRIEGKPRVKSRVTVRYVASGEGDRAVHIIVRPAQKKENKP